MFLRRYLKLAVLFFVFAAPSRGWATFDVSQFKVRTLTSWESSIHDSQLYPRSDRDSAFDVALTPLASVVEYTGRSRALSPEKRKFVTRLGHEVLKREDLAMLYEHEIEVKENGFPFWISVQKPLFPAFARELAKGEKFRIYYHFAGVAQGRQPVYLLVEFDSALQKN